MDSLRPDATRRLLDRAKGCLLGGAIGDSLGAPVEFLSLPAIRAQFGPDGIQELAPAYGLLGAVTDDTQMFEVPLTGYVTRPALLHIRTKDGCTPRESVAMGSLFRRIPTAGY
jgi:ADP-ribosylglycohydrolase